MTTYQGFRTTLGSALVALMFTTASAFAAPPMVPKPLPAPVQSQAPGIRPLGRGRQRMWGIHVYDATLWVVGDRFVPTEPHALDVEAGKNVSADTLVKASMDEMSRLKLGNASQLMAWSQELKRLMPNVRPGDQVVVFCRNEAKTLVYYNGRSQGEADDATLCPAIMNVWLHPDSQSKELRRSLLAQ
jgi:chalcone isomerase-like protein